MRPRYVLVCIAVSLLVAVLAVPSVRRLVAQVELALPAGEEGKARRAHRILQNSIRQEPPLVAVDTALRLAERGATEFDHLERMDPENGLYACLRILPDLTPVAPPGGADAPRRGRPLSTANPAPPPTGGRPAEDEQLAAQVRDLAAAGPVRLYAGRWRLLALEAYQAAGFSDRLAVYGADETLTGYSLLYRPVLRELADRLLAQGAAWREGGRMADAVRADTAVIRLMMNLVEDSPPPEVTLLAAEYIPAAIREITGGAATAGLPPHVVELGLAAVDRLEDLRTAWRRYSLDEVTNLLPHTGDVPPARAAHDRTIRSMLASGYCAETWLALALICMALLPFAGIAWRAGVVARWRWNGWGRWVAIGMVIAPMLLATLTFLAGGLSLAWLLSRPSIWSFVLPVLLVPVLVGWAAWICVELPDGPAAARLPRRAVWIMAGVAVVLLAGAALIPVSPESWRPSPGVQLFRRLGELVGIESLSLALIWIVWGQLRRRRLRLARGPLASASAAVAAWAWAATAVFAFGILQVNSRNDARHEQAFVAASADLMTDRLGAGWRDQYFEKTEELLAVLEKSGRMARLH